MGYFIKPGFWDKKQRTPKEGLDIDYLIRSRVAALSSIGQVFVAEGTDNYTVSIPGYTKYQEGDYFVITFKNANTGPSTININGLGAKNLVKGGSISLSPGEIQPNQPILCSTTLSVNTGDRVVEITVQGGRHESEIPLVDFSAELTFDEDKEYETVTGGATVFTLSADGHKNGVGIIARLNTPTSVTFPIEFEQLPGSDDISSTHMNIIVFRYLSNYDGQGNGKVHYSITNLTGI